MKHLAILAGVFLFAVSFAQTGAPPKGDQSTSTDVVANREHAKDTLAFMNHLNYLFAVLNTYNNVVVLQEEYDRLSLMQVDVTKIPSDAMMKCVTSALGTLHDLKMAESDYLDYQQQIEDSRTTVRRKMFFDLLKAGAGTVAVVAGAAGTAAAASAAAASAGTTAAVVPMTYICIEEGAKLASESFASFKECEERLKEIRDKVADYKETYKKAKADGKFNFDKNILPAEHEFARELNLNGADIVTGDEVKELIDCLKDDNRRRIYGNLRTNAMKRHYVSFPMFWFYLATTAVEAGDWKEALEAVRRFEQVNRGLVKVDPMAANVAIAKITAMIALGNPDKAEIRKSLELIQFVNIRDRYPDWSYFCASVYHGILADDEAAREVLKNLIGNLERKYENRLKKYCTLFDSGEVSVQENPIPVEINLLRARVLYKDVLKGGKMSGGDDGLVETLTRICSRSTTASLEKLYYVGDVRVSDLWKIAEKDVLGIRPYYVCNRFKKNEIVVDVPVNWFLLGEVESRIALVRGGKRVAELKEMKAKRSIRKNPDGRGHSIVRMHYVCTAKEHAGVDAIILEFPHESWPVEITYKPSAGWSLDMRPVKMEAAEFFSKSIVTSVSPALRACQYVSKEKNTYSYTPVQVVFMGEKRNLLEPPPDIQDYLRSTCRKDYSHVLLPFPKEGQRIDINTNFIVSAEIGEGRELKIAYTNETPKQGCIKFEVSSFSAFGAQSFHVEQEQKIRGNSGGDLVLKWPKELSGSELPSWLLVQYNVEQSVWDWWKNRTDASLQKDKKQ